MSNSEDSAGGHLALETLIAILILLIYTISAPIFEKYKFHYLHESGMCMIIGVAITLVAMVVSPEVYFTFLMLLIII